MLITKLYANYFGIFSGKEIELRPGINLIYGENEAGKSTLHTFIKGMLFGIDRLRGRGAASREDTYTRYLPWDYPGAYGGQMDIKLGDKAYRLQRSFHANDKSFTVLDLLSGREIKLKEDHISELIPGLTESAYRNTISIEQLRAETDSELASHLRNYITNLSIAKSKEVNVSKAIDALKERKKALEAMPFVSQLKSLKDDIKEGEAREEKLDLLTAKLKELEGKEQALIKQMDKHKSVKKLSEEEFMSELPAILEKYRAYRELSRQLSQLNMEIDNIKERIIEHQNYLEGIASKQEVIAKESKIRGLIYIAAAFVIGLLSIFVSKSFVVGLAVLGLILIIGLMLWTFYRRSYSGYKEENLKVELSLEHGQQQLQDLIARRKKAEDGCDELSDMIMLYMQEFISEDELTAEAIERLQDTIRSKRSEASREQEEYNKLLEEYRFQIGKIRWELDSLEENETELINNKEKYTYIMNKQRNNQDKLDALNLAISTIQELSSSIYDSFGLQLNKLVSDIIDRITNHKYQDIKIDEKLNIKLEWRDKYIMLDRLSAGTMDQVYFALRLATSDLLLADEPMPLILDDSFALYDDNRTKEALTTLAGRNQVIMFSCQKREMQLLEELGLEYNCIML